MRLSLIALMISVMAISCGRTSDNELSGEQEDNTLEEKIRSQQSERIVLLSAKYGLDSSSTAGLIDDYLMHFDVVTYVFLKVASGEPLESIPTRPQSVAETIDQLSDNYTLPREAVASIIIDYRILWDMSSR